MRTVRFDAIARERERLGIQMHATEICFIARAIRRPLSFLVFGMGNDSAFWSNLNRDGRTAFIEDQAMWFDRVKLANPRIEAYLVEYETKRAQAAQLIDRPEMLAMDLPPSVRDTKWDVILVDGPAGYDDETPGRMKSIYEASRLIKRGGSIFVHDHERPVEQAYADRYLLRENLMGETWGLAILRHYKFLPDGNHPPHMRMAREVSHQLDRVLRKGRSIKARLQPRTA